MPLRKLLWSWTSLATTGYTFLLQVVNRPWAWNNMRMKSMEPRHRYFLVRLELENKFGGVNRHSIHRNLDYR